MSDRTVSVLRAMRSREDDAIVVPVVLDYLAGHQISEARLLPADALRLAESLIEMVRLDWTAR